MLRNNIRTPWVLGARLRIPMRMVARSYFGDEYRGSDTLIFPDRRDVYKNFVCDIPDWEKKLSDYPEPEPQVTDFIECVKTRQPFALNERNGFRSATIVNMGCRSPSFESYASL